MNAWFQLLFASIFEVVFTAMLKLSQGGESTKFSLAAGLSGFLSFYFLSKAIVQMPLSLAYPIWTGIGTLGSIALGMLYFQEPFSLLKLGLLVILCSCIVGLSIIK